MVNGEKYQPIEDYGLIGNLHTTALISKQGSIDFLPYPRFDSPTIFAALLDNNAGGFFSVDITDKSVNHKQIYLPDTAVLLTRYLSDKGIAELTDFMVPLEKTNNFILIRKLKIIKGKQTFHIEINPRFNYGMSGMKVKSENGYLLIRDKKSARDAFRLISDIELAHKDDKLSFDITLKTKDEINFFMTDDHKENDSIVPHNLKKIADTYLDTTVRFWQQWIRKSSYNGRWQEIVNRSTITLKLLTSFKYGSTIAAATFGLPEHIGGVRNWDYRYSWIRDSSFTMYSFLQLGFNDEASRFIDWIEQRTQEIDNAGELKLMYRIDGGTDIEEEEIPNLEGYKKSKPVRKGNGAYKQFQLDIYGELVDTIFIYNKNATPISYQFWTGIVKFIDFVGDNWKEKDRGMWEVRNDTREFLISKVMSWVALDRGISIAEDRSFPAPLEKWRKIRNEIFNDVYYNYWNPDKKAFMQYRGASTLDSSALLIPLVRMLSPSEPRWVSTLEAIEKELITDSLVYRYKPDDGAGDGFPESEGTFSMCSFWYIECLAKMGDTRKAMLYFEKVLGYANHLGLFSEQISLKGELLGNFPQAFTHLGLISAAIKLKLLIEHGNLLRVQDSKKT